MPGALWLLAQTTNAKMCEMNALFKPEMLFLKPQMLEFDEFGVWTELFMAQKYQMPFRLEKWRT